MPPARRDAPTYSRCALARVALAAAALAAAPAGATILYKSVTANGVIQFSDTPPENATVVEERRVGEASDGQPVFGIAGLPSLAFANPLQALAEGGLPDERLAKANAQVDVAEHQLALARNSAWTRREGLRLRSAPRTRADDERIAFYQRSLAAARARLLAIVGARPDSPSGPAHAPEGARLLARR